MFYEKIKENNADLFSWIIRHNIAENSGEMGKQLDRIFAHQALLACQQQLESDPSYRRMDYHAGAAISWMGVTFAYILGCLKSAYYEDKELSKVIAQLVSNNPHLLKIKDQHDEHFLTIKGCAARLSIKFLK